MLQCHQLSPVIRMLILGEVTRFKTLFLNPSFKNPFLNPSRMGIDLEAECVTVSGLATQLSAAPSCFIDSVPG